MDFVRLWLGLLLPLGAALDFGYHHQEEMEAFLKSVARNYSSIARLHSIGKSVKGRSVSCTCPNPQSSLSFIKYTLASCPLSLELLRGAPRGQAGALRVGWFLLSCVVLFYFARDVVGRPEF